MQAATLIKQADKCISITGAKKLLDALVDAFQMEGSAIAHLETANGDYSLEDQGVFVLVEFNRVISEDYVTMIKPEIRDGRMVVYVATNRMLDGLGMKSQNWELAKAGQFELECEIEVDADDDILDVTRQAAEEAITQHQQLIEQVGVPAVIAAETAKQCWRGESPAQNASPQVTM